jgi:hypothetical protein
MASAFMLDSSPYEFHLKDHHLRLRKKKTLLEHKILVM